MKARGKPFQIGASGNPAGRPRGSRNRSSVALDAILEEAGEDIARKVIELAKLGDTVALRLCLDRLVPPRRDRPVAFDLPPLVTPSDAAKAMAAIVAAVAAGELTPSEASDLSRLVTAFATTLEVGDLHERVARLEGETP